MSLPATNHIRVSILLMHASCCSGVKAFNFSLLGLFTTIMSILFETKSFMSSPGSFKIFKLYHILGQCISKEQRYLMVICFPLYLSIHQRPTLTSVLVINAYVAITLSDSVSLEGNKPIAHKWEICTSFSYYAFVDYRIIGITFALHPFCVLVVITKHLFDSSIIMCDCQLLQ